ncbi:hypothetical protein [Pontibacter kalidii]|uniref:hypothetical protein n=1 Tax=Pontibacter kalidii TaxID=2592049 RepID=UPI0022578C98|nr:hypothetical protein [Pontibacter kalidii]
MVRVIIDKLGTGHSDLFLKIDNFQTFSKTGDSYYLLDFLELTEERLEERDVNKQDALKYATSKLINYWNSRIGTESKEIFLPFDFQDEYVGGLLLKVTEEGFVTKYVYSDRIHGYEINQSVFDKLIEERKIEFMNEEPVEWLISYEQLQKGLSWSLEELKK